jgi:hypothetical protein
VYSKRETLDYPIKFSGIVGASTQVNGEDKINFTISIFESTPTPAGPRLSLAAPSMFNLTNYSGGVSRCSGEGMGALEKS